MKRILEKYTGEKTYLYPSGGIGTPESVKSEFPGCELYTFVVTTNESRDMMYAMQSLSNLRARYEIDQSLSEDEAIKAIEELMNKKETENIESVTIPSAEERIAAALEYNNMMTHM